MNDNNKFANGDINNSNLLNNNWNNQNINDVTATNNAATANFVENYQENTLKLDNETTVENEKVEDQNNGFRNNFNNGVCSAPQESSISQNQNMPNQYNNFTNGQQIYNNGPVYYNQTPIRNKGAKGLKIAIFICILLLIGIGAFWIFKFCTDENLKNTNKINRTVMIYMVGSDLEADNKLATYDLNDINPENIDLENNNVLLMVGGSPKWHNYVDADELAIYKLTTDGFEKIKTYELDSMGDYVNLTNFLNYSYKNYRAKKYDLIFWNHGLGAYGLQSDEIFNDVLTIEELDLALKYSKFNEDNKLESVLFINCLSGNLQIANVLSDYAEYMIASEEISYAHQTLDKLDFLEQIEVDDDGKKFGIKFVKHFSEKIESYNKQVFVKIDSTYSVIDLSKIAEISKKFDKILESINLEEDYKSIARIRSNIETYGMSVGGDYDTVDLYNLVSQLKNYASKSDINELLDDIEEAIVYNWSLNDYSEGLSVYFPYHADPMVIQMHFQVLKDVSSKTYYNFITGFYELRTNRASIDSSLEENESSANLDEFKISLSNSEIENYASSDVSVYKHNDDGTYLPVYNSKELTLDEFGTLSFTNNVKVLKVINNETGISENIYLIEQDRNSEYTQYVTYAKLLDNNGSETNVAVYITVNEEHPNGVISQIVKLEEDLPSMVLLDLESYTSISFVNSKYNITNENGEYVEDWYDEGESIFFDVSTDNYSFELIDIQTNGEYFVVFKVNDIYNNNYYSKLIQIQ